MSTITENERHLLAQIGLSLVAVQATEALIRHSLRYVLPAGGRLTLESLELESRDERKKTLGQFLKELRRRVDLDDEFDRYLDDFLEHRNILVHRLESVWSIGDPATEQTLRAFLDRVLWLNRGVMRVFLALNRAYQIEIGSSVPAPATLFDQPEEVYLAVARSMFFLKDDEE